MTIDSSYFRPAEVDTLIGDACRARDLLGWQPTVDFEGLVTEMVNHDLDQVRDGGPDVHP